MTNKQKEMLELLEVSDVVIEDVKEFLRGTHFDFSDIAKESVDFLIENRIVTADSYAEMAKPQETNSPLRKDLISLRLSLSSFLTPPEDGGLTKLKPEWYAKESRWVNERYYDVRLNIPNPYYEPGSATDLEFKTLGGELNKEEFEPFGYLVSSKIWKCDRSPIAVCVYLMNNDDVHTCIYCGSPSERK